MKSFLVIQMTSNKTIREEFEVHWLNEGGKVKANNLAIIFSDCLTKLEKECGAEGREMALVKTKLQEASFFAKRAMAVKVENQV
jgi:hypothetical protein